MNIEVTAPDGSAAFPTGTPTSAMQAALARAYGAPQTAGAALAQLSDPQTSAAGQIQPDVSLAPLPPGGGYGPIADAAQASAGPWLNALASDPTPVWNGRLALLGHARAVRDAAGAMAGSMLDAGVSPALAGQNAKVEIDGHTGTTIDEAKFVGNAGKSPFVDGSSVPDVARNQIREREIRQFQRLGAIIADPSVPFNRLNVLTNHPAALPYFRSLMELHGIPGDVTVVRTAIPFR